MWKNIKIYSPDSNYRGRLDKTNSVNWENDYERVAMTEINNRKRDFTAGYTNS